MDNNIQPIQDFSTPQDESQATDVTPVVPIFAFRDILNIPDTSVPLANYVAGLQQNATTTQAGQGNNVFMIDPQQGIWLGAALFANAPFSVTMAGAVTASSLTTTHLDIPDTTTANSFHVDVNGNAWWGSTALATAVASVTKAGVATFTSVVLSGSVAISGIANNSATDISLMEKTHNLVFSVTDADTIAWTSGTIVMSNGRTFAISAGNTGNMAALTYIYLDTAVSSTVLQTTTTYSTAMGANKTLLGTAQNNTVTANFIPYGAGQILVDGANIGALSIVAGNIAASSITSTKISVSQLSAISADLGAVTAGTIVLGASGYLRSGQTDFDTGTGFFVGISGGTAKFSFGNSASNKITWDGSTLTIVGTVPDTQVFTSSGTWTKPAGAKFVRVQCWGGGGGGGGSATLFGDGSGGGGGGYTETIFNASDLSATVTITIGAGGAGGVAGDNPGTVGGNSTFGSYATAYGGGGGSKGSQNGGGGGGGALGVGAVGVATGGAGGRPIAGAGGNGATAATDSAFGGGGGGNAGSNVSGGYSGQGGGGGGTVKGSDTTLGLAGGNSVYGGGGGGGSGSATGGAGGTSVYGGAGGAGAGNTNDGSAGVAPSGGGGGAESFNGASKTGGAGARGEIRVYTS